MHHSNCMSTPWVPALPVFPFKHKYGMISCLLSKKLLFEGKTSLLYAVVRVSGVLMQRGFSVTSLTGNENQGCRCRYNSVLLESQMTILILTVNPVFLSYHFKAACKDGFNRNVWKSIFPFYQSFKQAVIYFQVYRPLNLKFLKME